MDSAPNANDGWSYWVLQLSNPNLEVLERTLNRAGTEGWELVTSVSTNKMIAVVSANQLVFVLKKRGAGHAGPAWASTGSGVGVDQSDHLKALLTDRLGASRAFDTLSLMRTAGLWTPESVYAISLRIPAMGNEELDAWSRMPTALDS